MKRLIGIISDDFTGANDSGIHLVENGINTSVLFDIPNDNSNLEEGVVIDTDSRRQPSNVAYEKTKNAGFFLKDAEYKIIYKKIDSTLRGHIAIELKALEEVFQPAFVIIAPSLPMYNRVTKKGVHYLNGRKLSKTEISRDFRHPIKCSHIPSLLEKELNKKVGLLKTKELGDDLEKWKRELEKYRKNGTKFIVCDAENKEDLISLSKKINYFEERIIWAGSAGLIEVLPKVLKLSYKSNKFNVNKYLEQTLIVCGSLSQVTKEQVSFIKNNQSIYSIEIDTLHIFSEEWIKFKENYIKSSLEGIRKGKNVLLFLTFDPKIIKQVSKAGKRLNLNPDQISSKISTSLSDIVSVVLNESDEINSLVLTGGDIAKSVAVSLNAIGFKLISQAKPGMPFGSMIDTNRKIYAVTKAGAFGESHSIYQVLQYLKG